MLRYMIRYDTEVLRFKGSRYKNRYKNLNSLDKFKKKIKM